MPNEDDFDDELDEDEDEFEDDSEDGGDYEDDESDEEPDEDAKVEDDEFAWLREAGADKVKKTWTQYTQTREEALSIQKRAETLEKELEPYKKLKEDVLADPGLVSLIEGYYQNGRPADREILDVKREMQGLKAQMSTERELSEVRSWAKENKYPVVADAEVLQYAVDHNIGNLTSAYKDMMFEQVQERKADQLAKDIKKSRGAKSPTSRKPTDGGRVSMDLLSMSDEDFIKNYDKIREHYSR